MSWFMHHAVLFALLCAAAAVIYGIYLTTWLLGRPAGNERMQEIARAIQEGAGAYRRRRLLLASRPRVQPLVGVRRPRSRGARVRRLAHLGVRTTRRRHLHKGR